MRNVKSEGYTCEKSAKLNVRKVLLSCSIAVALVQVKPALPAMTSSANRHDALRLHSKTNAKDAIEKVMSILACPDGTQHLLIVGIN